MYLKRIEIAGFKSFADRTVIDFENSVTAVVGPNGSGKSNITEAIRWVLGEQSAKSLRGGKMPDIIFAGSESRKPLNIAEVTVTLDNSDHYLPLDFSEISVTRRFRRTGESDFFINKQSCRLKDIQDLFMDSGLGKESFSIISQGKVEAIFSSKPEDRRGIFEEAAGVLKYKQRKKKAEQKLFETEDNLSRVQDIIYELEDQLVPLATQSEAAKHFLQLKEALTEIDVRVNIREIAEAKVLWEEQSQALNDLNQTLATLVEGIRHSENSLVDLRQKRGSADQAIEQAQSQLLHLTESLKQVEGQREVLQERSKNTLKNTQEYQESLKEATEKAQQSTEAIVALAAALQDKTDEQTELGTKIQAAQKELIKYQKSTKELIEELRGQQFDIMQSQANVGNELKNLEQQYQQESSRNQQALAKHDKLITGIESLQQQVATLTAEHQTLETSLTSQREAYTKAQAKRQEEQQLFDSQQKAMYQLMNKVQTVGARKKSLQEIKENYNGFYQGVRLILQQKNQMAGLVGAVAELIEVPTDYTLAIETALGGAAQHVVVENEKVARDSITFLKERRGGRATFLPLTTIKPRYLNKQTRQQAAEVPGFLGVASELVSFPETIQAVVENLLGTVIIAKDLKSANQIAQTIHYQSRVVSLEGDVMNAGGSMTGGANKKGNQGGLFAQGQELQQLTEHYQKLDAQLQQSEQQVKATEARVKEAVAEVEELRNTGESTRFKEQELANKLENAQSELQRLEKEQQVFHYESQELQKFLTEYTEQKQQLEAQKEQLQEQQQANQAEMTALTEESDLLEQKRQAATKEVADLQASEAVCQEQKHHLEQQLQLANEQLAEHESRKASLLRQLESLDSAFSSHEDTEESLSRRQGELQEKLTAIQEVLSLKKAERGALQAEVDRTEEQLTIEHRQQKEQMAQQTKLEVQKNRAELALDNGLQYLQEEYSLTFEGASETYLPIEDLDAGKREVRQLKREIDALGPVNLNAIEQYEQVKERHDFLTSQRDDLLSAKDQLFETMEEMDQEVKERFHEVFEAIREQFKVVFPNMFGGGRAELVLTDPTDLLNTGIEIEAQPPGKKLQSLSLLSGGERALTAIALLFSIIQVRPVPFCVLDEVEAALDDANVARFGHYLSQFQDDTQFIVVTHRKGTMEAANVLYGVTMQESGVSKIVSVRLEDVVEGGKIVANE